MLTTFVRLQVFIVTEYMNAGNLRMLWQRRMERGRARLQWNTLTMLLRDAARGLRHLHMSNLLHRDIKTENFLVQVGPGAGEIRCVVCDFGFSRNINMRSGGLARAMTICGTETFMAPEVLISVLLYLEIIRRRAPRYHHNYVSHYRVLESNYVYCAPLCSH